MTLSTGIVPAIGSPVHDNPRWKSAGVFVQCTRESAECVRLSPITRESAVGHLDRAEVGAQARVDLRIDRHRDRVQIRLADRLAVHRESRARTALDGLAAHRDDPFDSLVLVGRNQPEDRKGVLQPTNVIIARYRTTSAETTTATATTIVRSVLFFGGGFSGGTSVIDVPPRRPAALATAGRPRRAVRPGHP